MVNKDYNHPSVIMYSIGNEVSETAKERGIRLTKDMTAFVHSLDNTRPVTCGINLMLNGLASIGRGIYKEEGQADKAWNTKKKKGPKKEKLSGSAFINMVMNSVGLFMTYIGRMQRLGSANPYTEEVFDKDYHDTFFGGAQAIIRSGYESGQVAVTVSADGLERKEVVLRIQ